MTLVPVTNTQGEGSLVIVNFLRDEHEELDRTLQTYTLIALLSLGLITTIAAFQSGRLLAPLRTLESTAREITTTDLSRRIPERGNDDITALTRTINSMLERLDSGFAAQRQFLDDAGHELKTPLTVLRGHLELLDGEDPAELAQTRELLLDEVDRMSRLVQDLILLAKSRRPDFLVLGEVHLADLTQSVLAKATALGDREWQLDGVARGRAVLDEQRVTQALLQLADNAVKHTDPGAAWRSARPARTAWCGCGSATPATGSRPRTATPCSSGSAAATCAPGTTVSASGQHRARDRRRPRWRRTRSATPSPAAPMWRSSCPTGRSDR